MSRAFRRTAAVLLIILGPATAVVTWRRVTAPVPPLVSNAGDLDPLVARLISERIELVRSLPRDAGAWAALAMVYQAHRFTDEAEMCYRQALAFEPADPPSWYHLARSRARRGEFEDAIVCVDHAIALETAYPPLYWQRGEWLLELGRLEEAEASFRHAMEADPGEAAGVHGIARVYLQQGRYEDTIALLGPVVARNEEDAYARHLIGRAYRGLNRDEEADRYARSSEVVPPTRFDPWAWVVAALRTGYSPTLKRTEAMVQSGEADAAIPILLDVRATYGPEARTLNALAGAYAASGRPHDAIRALRELLKANPDHYRPHLNLASQYERIGNLDAALEVVRAAIRLAPRPEAMATEGRLLLAKNDLAGAAAAFERAVAAGANEPLDRVALANLLNRLGRTADALVLYYSAIDDAPDLVPAHAGLAIALASISEFRDARSALERARAIAPDDPVVEQAARRLDEMENAGG